MFDVNISRSKLSTALLITATTCTYAAAHPINKVVESNSVLRGSELLPPLDPDYEISVASFGGSLATDGDILATGSPWSEFISSDDPLDQVVGSGVITLERRGENNRVMSTSITPIALENALPFDPNICNQVWQLGRTIDVDDLGIEKDGAHVCRVVTSWLRFASSFCTQRRQSGVFTIRFLEGSDPTWTLEQVFDAPTLSTDFGASIALEGDSILIGAPGGGGPTGGGRVYLYGATGGTYVLEHTLAPFQIKELNFGDCQFDIEDYFLIYGRNDRFGNDIDISEDGTLAVIGAPGTIDDQTAFPRYVDGAGAMYVVRLDGTTPDIRFIPNPDSGSITSCGTAGSGCTPSADHAQGDAFGTSVAITLISEENAYRFAATAPGDFGLTIANDGSSELCEEDHGLNQGVCHLQTGSVAIYDFSSLDDWPSSGPEWIPEPRKHWKPGAERAAENNWGFAYAHIGGHSNTNSTPGFATGGSLDLQDYDVLVGGPSGSVTNPSGTIDISPCEDWPSTLRSNRGTALVVTIPINPEDPIGAFRELVPADEPYPPSWRFGESVALINGKATVSLSLPESAQCEQGSNVDCEGMGSIYVFKLGDLPGIPGDLNIDGVVNGADLGLFLSVWGSQGPIGDLNGDGWVNGIDLGLMLVNWSSS